MAEFGFIVYGEINQVSGGYYYDRMLISSLENRGHSVTVLTPVEAKKLEAKAVSTIDGYILDELCHPDFTALNDFPWIKSNRVTIAMVHHLAAEERLGLIPRLAHLQQEKNFFSFIDYAICNSAATELSIRNKARYGGPSGIALPGITEINSKAPQRQEIQGFGTPVKLLTLGNVIPRKGIHHVLSCMALKQKIPATLDIAGDHTVDPAYTEKLRKQIVRQELTEMVQFSGYVSENEKYRKLAEADFLVVPSDHEGYGIVYLEAMEHGTVPVGSRSGGAGEVIKHGENGFLVKPKSPRAIHGVISRCCAEPGLYETVSLNARSTWLDHPTWEETFSKVITDIEALISPVG